MKTKTDKFEHPGGLYKLKQLTSAREKIRLREQPYLSAYESLAKEADKCLLKPAQAVEDFNVPGYYIEPEGHIRMMGLLSTDSWTAYSCAIAYQMTDGDRRSIYAEKAISTISAWAETNRKTSNHDGDLAMADSGIGLVLAAELMTDCKDWSDDKRRSFRSWLESVYLVSCVKIAPKQNNWGDWGIFGCLASHYYLDDVKALKEDVSRIAGRIDEAISSDGSMPHETGRGNNGIWYTYFALAPLTAACQIAYNSTGANLFSYKGRSGAGIEEALDYLLKYCREPRSWPHYSGNDLTLPNPAKWPGNLFEAMSVIYGRRDYEDWIRNSRPIIYSGHHYAWTVPTLLRVDHVPDAGRSH